MEKRSTTKYRAVQEARKRDFEEGQNPKVYSIIKDYSDNEEPPKGEPQCKCAKCGTVFDQIIMRMEYLLRF